MTLRCAVRLGEDLVITRLQVLHKLHALPDHALRMMPTLGPILHFVSTNQYGRTS
jgi:hypothetical protein